MEKETIFEVPLKGVKAQELNKLQQFARSHGIGWNKDRGIKKESDCLCINANGMFYTNSVGCWNRLTIQHDYEKIKTLIKEVDKEAKKVEPKGLPIEDLKKGGLYKMIANGRGVYPFRFKSINEGKCYDGDIRCCTYSTLESKGSSGENFPFSTTDTDFCTHSGDRICVEQTEDEKAKHAEEEHANGVLWNGKELVKIPTHVKVVRKSKNDKAWHNEHIGEIFPVLGLSNDYIDDGWHYETSEGGILIRCTSGVSKEAYEAQETKKAEKKDESDIWIELQEKKQQCDQLTRDLDIEKQRTSKLIAQVDNQAGIITKLNSTCDELRAENETLARKSIDKVFTNELQLALRTAGIFIDEATIEKILDIVELLEEGKNTLSDISKLQSEWEDA